MLLIIIKITLAHATPIDKELIINALILLAQLEPLTQPLITLLLLIQALQQL